MSDPVLRVEDLHVTFPGREGDVRAVRGVSYALKRGEILGIVGESGSGKSACAQAVMGLLPSSARVSGSVRLGDDELVGLDDRGLSRVRGERISMIFQDPLSALTPVYTVGDQIAEAIRSHHGVTREAAAQRAVALLELVGIPQAARRARAFPHEFSGGMRQRVMIAMALALDPEVLIADEPTTALDVTIQAQILRLLENLNRDRNLSVVLITHDLGVVAELADRVVVMYGGQIVEDATLDEIFYNPQHPYTWGLLGSIARLDEPRPERLTQIAGQPPSLLTPPTGCRFAARCKYAFDKCTQPPALEARLGDATHLDRCWLTPAEKLESR